MATEHSEEVFSSGEEDAATLTVVSGRAQLDCGANLPLELVCAALTSAAEVAVTQRAPKHPWQQEDPEPISARAKIGSHFHDGTCAHTRPLQRDAGAAGAWELFAQAPIDQYPGIAVETVTDSSRYFVIRIQDGNGRSAFIGIGFGDRGDAFDFNVSLQDHFKAWWSVPCDTRQGEVGVRAASSFGMACLENKQE
ncbi:UNVERIFIED_CONTAM: hypothetical protein K2H54_060636 [Gekko kuhli]